MAEVHDNSTFASPGDVPIETSREPQTQQTAMPATVLCLNPVQSAAIAAANDIYGLADAHGQPICVRRQENGQHDAQAVVAFTPEQWEIASKANGTVEVRSHDGRPLGYLVLNPHVNLFYTIRETELLLKRARESKPGRTLGEILGEALTRAGA